jgi:glucuronate isomerase
MMKGFMGEDFLLETDKARTLYHDYAKDMPIYDYHCHLSAQQIADNTQFENLTQVWLAGDHYKWRVMRANGVDERFCTGNASDWEKFKAWAETVPYTLGNPLYHWTHLELKAYFGIKNKQLSGETAKEIWDTCNAKLKTEPFHSKGILERMNVKLLCTTDDPIDNLDAHKAIQLDRKFKTKVYPAFRPDQAMSIEKGSAFVQYLDLLSKAAGIKIRKFTDLLNVLDNRHHYFHGLGCRLSDHGLHLPVYEEASEKVLDRIMKKALGQQPVTETEEKQFKTAVLLHCGRLNAKRGWAFQLHMGVMRDCNTRQLNKLGPNTGYDSIGEGEIAKPLIRFLDALDKTGELPPTILYVLNPRDNDVIAAAIGCFQDGKMPGKIQFGSAWWFNDHQDGMIRQMTTLANMGLLSRFIGMLTDSRSFLSYPRHEYFRRIFCNLIGNWVEKGQAPRDMKLLGRMVKDICFNNAANYFKMEI